jgi:hypothetical protein
MKIYETKKSLNQVCIHLKKQKKNSIFSSRKFHKIMKISQNKEIAKSSVYISKQKNSFAEETFFFHFFSSRKKISQNMENSPKKKKSKKLPNQVCTFLKVKKILC